MNTLEPQENDPEAPLTRPKAAILAGCVGALTGFFIELSIRIGSAMDLGIVGDPSDPETNVPQGPTVGFLLIPVGFFVAPYVITRFLIAPFRARVVLSLVSAVTAIAVPLVLFATFDVKSFVWAAPWPPLDFWCTMAGVTLTAAVLCALASLLPGVEVRPHPRWRINRADFDLRTDAPFPPKASDPKRTPMDPP